MQWSPEAKKTLHEHVRKSTNQTPTDDIYTDLFTDLTAHVEEEMHHQGKNHITKDSLQSILTTIGENEFEETPQKTPNTPPPKNQSEINHNSKTKSKFSTFKTFCAWLFTIIIPSIALFVELSSHQSRSIFFDPIPTWIHVLFIAIIPITFIHIIAYRKKLEQTPKGELIDLKSIKLIKAMLGFTLPVIIYYTILYLPTTPIAIIACMFLVGLLPLAPLFCLIGWLRANAAMSDILHSSHHPKTTKWMKYGLTSGLVSLIALEAPSYLSQKAITDAGSKDPKISQKGIENIRFYGGEDALLYLSYHGESRTRGMNARVGNSPAHWVQNFFFTRSLTSEKARILYYKVTGIPFNSIEPPKNNRGNDYMMMDQWDWDQDHGGDAVAGVTRGLSLHSSRMDMHVDDHTRLGYVEWIIQFKNSQPTAKEARMQIGMPHNGFVSKLTLWVNGEERPAAFNTVAKVKSAYQKIAVQQRRDPVLVNVSGADRVMLQCFPVPPNDGIMKMKVGITFPLSRTESTSGNIHFPYIAERNFSIENNLKHQIYAQANLQINAPKSNRQESGNIHTLQYTLDNPSLKTERITWKDTTPSNNSTIWTIDPFHKAPNNYLIRQISENSTILEKPKSKVIVVVDSSACMNKWKPMLSQLILENNPSIDFYIASNQQNPLIHCDTVEQFKDIQFVGGIDNVPALRKALLLTKQNKQNPTSILWIHGPQPIKFPSLSGLEQDLERSLNNTPIYNIALEDGANLILEALKGCQNFKGGCRVVNKTDLVHMAESIIHPKPDTHYTWTHATSPPENGTKTWDQLARKWAYQNTMNHLKEPKSSTLAATYQLVTPLSGAVVLETAQQYKETGLEVPDTNNAPALPIVPEPSSTLLILIAAFITTMRRNRHH